MSVFRASRAWLLTTAMAGAYLLVSPPSADLAAQDYRGDEFLRSGFLIWDNSWYGGHHMPGYSVLSPPLGALITPEVTGSIAAVACALLFGLIARDHWSGPGQDGRLAAWWFAGIVGASLLTGRMTFTLGVAVGLGAIRCAQIGGRWRTWGAPAAAFLCTAASPVAGLFLAMALGAWFLADRARRRDAVTMGVATVAPLLFLTLAFPEGGTQPFPVKTFVPGLIALLVLLIVLPRRERTLRIGTAIYAAAVVLSFVVDTPMGSNATRLAELFAGPVMAGVLWPQRRVLLCVLAVPMLYWQLLGPAQEWQRSRNDPSVTASFYTGLRHFLGRQSGPPFRVEVPFTKSHWESRYVAAVRPLARGWERQLDIRRDGLFYDGTLTPATYRRWLDDQGVRFVAVPRGVGFDVAGQAEAKLVRGGLPYLTPVWSDAHWQVYEVRDPAPLARGGAELVAMTADGFTLRADTAPTSTVVHVHFTPYWVLEDGAAGCVSPAPGDWTRVTLRRAGTAHVGTRFAFGRIRATSPRCTG